MNYRITDGVSHELAESIQELSGIAEDWYDYLADEGRLSILPRPNLDDSSLETLEESIRDWEERIAEAMGASDFHGHGNYSVTAAQQIGLRLHIEEVEED